MLLKILIATGELMLAEPTATIGTQWRWVDTFQNQIILLINHIRL